MLEESPVVGLIMSVSIMSSNSSYSVRSRITSPSIINGRHMSSSSSRLIDMYFSRTVKSRASSQSSLTGPFSRLRNVFYAFWYLKVLLEIEARIAYFVKENFIEMSIFLGGFSAE